MENRLKIRKVNTNMRIPSIPEPNYKLSDDKIKALTIMRKLTEMGYDIGSKQEAIAIIESEGIEKFNFDYPYGSFEAFKQHVLAGEFDVHVKLGTKEHHEELEKAVREGKLWKTY